MPYWRFQPVASPGDRRWQGRRMRRGVIVRAATPGLAILYASAIDRPMPPPKVGNETLGYRSGFEDEKLYHLRRLADGAIPAADGAAPGDGVISPGIVVQGGEERPREPAQGAARGRSRDQYDDKSQN